MYWTRWCRHVPWPQNSANFAHGRGARGSKPQTPLLTFASRRPSQILSCPHPSWSLQGVFRESSCQPESTCRRRSVPLCPDMGPTPSTLLGSQRLRQPTIHHRRRRMKRTSIIFQEMTSKTAATAALTPANGVASVEIIGRRPPLASLALTVTRMARGDDGEEKPCGARE